MNRQELYRLARRNIERGRLNAEAGATARRRALARDYPEWEALAAQQAEAGARAARLAADGQAQEAEKALEAVHALAQQRQKLLKKAGLGEADINPAYACAACKDTGLAGGQTCGCVHKEAARLRREEVNHAGPLSLCRFENFSLERYPEKMEGVPVPPRRAMEAILRDCRDWAAEFGPRSPSLLLYGDAGLGKTHLALSIASQVLDAGYDVIYVSAQSAFAAVTEQRYDGGAMFASMLEADLLVLDDLGTEYLDAYLLSRLYELVNGRMHRRPTIYTTNICKQDLLYQRYTEKIASRLLGDCHLMRFWGKDLRLERLYG